MGKKNNNLYFYCTFINMFIFFFFNSIQDNKLNFTEYIIFKFIFPSI